MPPRRDKIRRRPGSGFDNPGTIDNLSFRRIGTVVLSSMVGIGQHRAYQKATQQVGSLIGMMTLVAVASMTIVMGSIVVGPILVMAILVIPGVATVIAVVAITIGRHRSTTQQAEYGDERD